MKRPSCPNHECASCDKACHDESAANIDLFEEEPPADLTEEQAKAKKAMYEQMSPRRRKFIDRIGYDIWDPFQEPKQPLDIRKERTQRTLQDLMRDFFRENDSSDKDPAWRQGACDCALGIIKKDGRFQGIFDFCLWYNSLLEKEGHRRKK